MPEEGSLKRLSGLSLKDSSHRFIDNTKSLCYHVNEKTFDWKKEIVL